MTFRNFTHRLPSATFGNHETFPVYGFLTRRVRWWKLPR